jgi:hypothetical protein
MWRGELGEKVQYPRHYEMARIFCEIFTVLKR